MMNVNLISALLCILSWTSVSVSQFYTVEAQPGEEVTLQCSNFSTFASHIFWFKLADRSDASCISVMSSAYSGVNFFHGFQDDRFNMGSRTSVLFLIIKGVDSSDSGLYFCGELHNGRPKVFTATYLKVQDGLTNRTSVVLGSLTVFLLLVIFGLVFKIYKLHTAQDQWQNSQHSEVQNVDPDAVNYAALSFHPKMRRPEPQREPEPNVVYAAARTSAKS